MQKTSIRFYNGIQVRAVWVDETHDWWYSATDLIAVLTESKNPRIYWNTLKTRNPQMNTFCRQLKYFFFYKRKEFLFFYNMSYNKK